MDKKHQNLIHLNELPELFKEYSYIAAAYLFGSCATGKAGPMSDVDIAILLEDGAPKGRELIHEEDYLAYRIQKLLHVREVDVIDLNRQGVVFQHNVLRTGRLIYDADPPFRIRFVLQVISRYCDFKPTLNFIKKYQMQGLIQRCRNL